jgi:spore coat protein JB
VIAVNERELMMKIKRYDFALKELNLYLDTHPWDLQMVEAHNKASAKYKVLRSEFEEKFCPLTAAKAQGFEWLKGPWPWEYEECGC